MLLALFRAVTYKTETSERSNHLHFFNTEVLISPQNGYTVTFWSQTNYASAINFCSPSTNPEVVTNHLSSGNNALDKTAR